VESKHTLAEYQRSYYQQRKRLGVCVKCGRKAEAGKSRCDVCGGKDRDVWKALHPVVCRECKQPIESKERAVGRRYHKLCAQRLQAREYPRKHRLASLAYQRKHKEMGLCISCPKKAFKAGLCRKHYRLTTERNYSARN